MSQAEQLSRDGIGTDLANDFHYDDDVAEIERGISLIDENKREGLEVVMMGECLQSVALFETNYVLYERRRAEELHKDGGFGRIITRDCLINQKRSRLAEADSETSAENYSAGIQ
ncbi:MAG TPA: hypothetical protein VJG90_08905 [Candidatus Nanoarchaeia archaeon]|nr:hypothetical protein [Candidatus Nanoarchaeia archaeon]